MGRFEEICGEHGGITGVNEGSEDGLIKLSVKDAKRILRSEYGRSFSVIPLDDNARLPLGCRRVPIDDEAPDFAQEWRHDMDAYAALIVKMPEGHYGLDILLHDDTDGGEGGVGRFLVLVD